MKKTVILAVFGFLIFALAAIIAIDNRNIKIDNDTNINVQNIGTFLANNEQNFDYNISLYGLNCTDAGENCGPGLEQGYNPEYLTKGCKQWEKLPLSGHYDYYYYIIDLDSLDPLSEGDRQSFINNVDLAASTWNSTRIHYDSNKPIVRLYNNTYQLASVKSSALTCTIKYDKDLKDYGEFIPVLNLINIRSFDYSTILHEFGHLLGLQDLDYNRTHKHTSLMGYANTTNDLTYHDIVGLATVNSNPRTCYYYRWIKDENKYVHVCFYCDLRKTESSPMQGSKEMIMADSCNHSYKQLVSAGARHWLKCENCYKVVESEFFIEGTNDSITITGLINKSTSMVNIPTEIGGQLVTKIGAYAFQENNAIRKVYFDYYSIPGTEFVIEEYAFYSCINLSFMDFPTNLVKIEEHAFDSCINLYTTGICPSIEVIEDYAFYMCRSLICAPIYSTIKSIGANAFSMCVNIKSIDLSNCKNLISIGDKAFYNCQNINNITIPSSVITIGNSILQNCCQLETLYFNAESCMDFTQWKYPFANIGCKGLKVYFDCNKIPNYIFYNVYEINDTDFSEAVKVIGSYAFSGCTRLKSFTVPSNVEKIGDYILNGCNALEAVYINSENLKNFNKYSEPFAKTSSSFTAYINCSNVPPYIFNKSDVNKIILGSSVRDIGDYAFNECSKLASITISNNVEILGSYILKDCVNLKEVNFNSNKISSIYHSFNDINSQNLAVNFDCETVPDYILSGSEVKEIHLSDRVTSIGNYAFANCDNLAAIELPLSITSIGNYAFANCDNLAAIELPLSITSIGNYAFANCDNIVSIEIPKNIKNIGDYILSGCSNLETLYFNSESCTDFYSDRMPFANIGCQSLDVYFNCTKVPQYIFYNAKGIGDVVLSEKVNTIGKQAFSESSITSVYLSGNTINLEDWVFAGCNSLERIIVASDNPIYVGDSNCLIRKSDNTLVAACKTSVIPDYVVNIAKDSYKNLTAITSLKIPNTVKHIEDGAFSGCSKLSSIYLPIANEDSCVWQRFYLLFGQFPSDVPYGLYVNITNGTVIHKSAFLSCNRIYSITLPDTIEILDEFAFDSCTALKRINLPDSIVEIRRGAFDTCINLEALIIPSSVEKISEGVFWNCDNLLLIQLQRTASDGITMIEYGAFRFWDEQSHEYIAECKNLMAIVVHDKDSYLAYKEYFKGVNEFKYADMVTYYGDKLEYTLMNDGTYSLTKGNAALLHIVEIPLQVDDIPVTAIGNGAFRDCELITSVKIPASVCVIGSEAFYGCTSLYSIEIQRHISLGLVQLSDDMLNDDCWNFTHIILPDIETYTAYVNAYPQFAEYFNYYDSGLKFELKSDGTYKIVGGTADNELGAIIIPAYYNGKPVTEIADEAFMYGDMILVIFMGDSNITTIGNRAFYGCDNLWGIELPQSVQYIGNQVFGSSAIKSITLRSNVYVANGAFDSNVVVYTDASSASENWHFLQGNYIFFNCRLSETGNYVETVYSQNRGDFVGDIYSPYRQLFVGYVWSSNMVLPYIITEHNELLLCYLWELKDDTVPIGTMLYVNWGYVSMLY